MYGRERGLVSILKAHHPDLITCHCVIHQMVLCASLGKEFLEIMSIVMKLINFLRASSALQNHLLRSFLTEVDAEFDDLLLHNNVRWLSKGKVLDSFRALRKEFVEFLQNNENMESATFLKDITCHLNDLILKLQGKNNTVCNLMSAVRAFQRKLNIFKSDLQEGGLLHFPNLKGQASGPPHHKYVEFLAKLIENFETQFGDFPL